MIWASMFCDISRIFSMLCPAALSRLSAEYVQLNTCRARTVVSPPPRTCTSIEPPSPRAIRCAVVPSATVTPAAARSRATHTASRSASKTHSGTRTTSSMKTGLNNRATAGGAGATVAPMRSQNRRNCAPVTFEKARPMA